MLFTRLKPEQLHNRLTKAQPSKDGSADIEAASSYQLLRNKLAWKGTFLQLAIEVLRALTTSPPSLLPICSHIWKKPELSEAELVDTS